MKIDAITAKYPQQNFKGLFRTVKEVKDETYYEPAYEADLGTRTERTTIYYYPFADEDQYNIDRFVSHNTFRHEDTPVNPNSSDQTTKVKEGIVYVQKPLNITEKEYNDYKESMNKAKTEYEAKQELARQKAIRALAPKSINGVEKELEQTNLGEWIVK